MLHRHRRKSHEAFAFEKGKGRMDPPPMPTLADCVWDLVGMAAEMNAVTMSNKVCSVVTRRWAVGTVKLELKAEG
jgi:hypothetical protein